MPQPIVLEFDKPPKFWPVYRRVVFSRKPGLKTGDTLPAIFAQWRGAKVDAEKLAGYRDACGFKDNGKLPLTYPHVLCSGIHLSMMSHPKFPLKLLGAVHARNIILQHRPIGAKEPLDVFCRVGQQRPIKAGIEWDISTVIVAEGRRVWESLSTYLVRGKFGEAFPTPEEAKFEDLGQIDIRRKWPVPADMGKRYARISGDFNPIHVSPTLARFFGFEKDLVHGMWSLARCLVQLPKLDEAAPDYLRVAFKGPVYMGSSVEMCNQLLDKGHRFDLFCAGNPRPVINGVYTWSPPVRMLVGDEATAKPEQA